MGKALGAFADDSELDRGDLNKCPDCNCFFAETHCPMCGKECPEEMRAGNRPAVKPQRRRATTSTGAFISWYHSWWFMALMTLLFPIVGIILLITSPHIKWKKILFVSLAVVYMFSSFFGAGTLLTDLQEIWDPPVDSTITKEEYIARCAEISPEQFYRAADGYKDKFVSMTVQITEKVTCVNDYYNDEDFDCYLCVAEDNYDFRLILRDCLLDDNQRFIPGDVITIYGEGAGVREVYDKDYYYTSAPCLNMAYVTLNR